MFVKNLNFSTTEETLKQVSVFSSIKLGLGWVRHRA